MLKYKCNTMIRAILILLVLSTTAYAQTPFDKFLPEGETIPLLELKEKPVYQLENRADEKIAYLKFDKESLKLKAFNIDDKVLYELQLEPTDKKWLSVDPKADEFPHQSPCIAMSSDPINKIDPDGQADYYYNQEGTQLMVSENDNPDRFFEANSADYGDQYIFGTDLENEFIQISMDSDKGITARVIYAEARGQNDLAKEVVGDIIYNRVHSKRTYNDNYKLPNTFTNVILQDKQFTSTSDGEPNQPAFLDPQTHYQNNPIRERAFASSMSAAIKTVNGHSLITQGAELYFSPMSMVPRNSKPRWNFNVLDEVKVEGINPNEFRMFRYKK